MKTHADRGGSFFHRRDQIVEKSGKPARPSRVGKQGEISKKPQQKKEGKRKRIHGGPGENAMEVSAKKTVGQKGKGKNPPVSRGEKMREISRMTTKQMGTWLKTGAWGGKKNVTFGEWRPGNENEKTKIGKSPQKTRIRKKQY